MPLLAVGVLVVAALCVTGVQRYSHAMEERRLAEEAAARAAAEAAKPKPSFSLEEADLDAFEGGAEVSGFTLAKNDKTPKLSAKHRDAIETAVGDLVETADLSFVFLNTETGRGITYSPDTEIYGASSYKAPYALFVCEQLVEPGRISLGNVISSRTTGAVKGLIEDSIIWSSNKAFTTLRANYDSLQHNEWAAALGVRDAPAGDGVWFPSYGARSSVKIWREMAGYFEFGSETSVWLKDLLTKPEESFIRDGVMREGMTVYNKAGWTASGEGFNSTSDAGIIEYKGSRYIMSIMCARPYSDASRASVSALADALFDARSALEWEKSKAPVSKKDE